MKIVVKNTLIEIHDFLSMIKYYHRPLWQVCSIINTVILDIKPNLTLQIFFKVINDLVSLNKLVFILLVMSIYSKMTKQDGLSLSIIYYVIAISKAIDKIQKFIVS